MIIQEKLGIDERINEAFQPISNFWEGLILHNPNEILQWFYETQFLGL